LCYGIVTISPYGVYPGPVGMMMAVSFERYGRLYYLDPGEYEPKIGDKVLVPTDGGPEVAECVWAPQWVSEEVGGLPVCAGLAGEEDLARDEENRRRRAEGRLAAKRLIRELELPMKVTAVDYLSATNVFTVYFSAPHRVDFRALVRDLAARLRARVELRQIGPRDEARLQGGIGPCGRDLCCATFLKDFEPVSVRMAKDQDLPVNPLRIAGACGRLMCCLKYEHPLYQDFKKDAPRDGTQVDTPEGAGTVVGHNVPSDTVVVKLTADGRTCACSRASVCGSRKAYDSMYGKGQWVVLHTGGCLMTHHRGDAEKLLLSSRRGGGRGYRHPGLSLHGGEPRDVSAGPDSELHTGRCRAGRPSAGHHRRVLRAAAELAAMR
jgi:cell fate regulator YaaT (PSP1 superfamily)